IRSVCARVAGDPLERNHRWRTSARLRRGCVGVEQPMQVHDEIAHMRVVDGLLRLGLPGPISARVIRKNTDHLDLVEVLEFRAVEVSQFAAKHKMQELFALGRLGHHMSPTTLKTKGRALALKPSWPISRAQDLKSSRDAHFR